MVELFLPKVRSLGRSLALLVTTLLVACATPPQGVTVVAPVATDARVREELPVVSSELGQESYIIAVNDELIIKFTDQADLNELVRVRPDGNISLQGSHEDAENSLGMPVTGRVPFIRELKKGTAGAAAMRTLPEWLLNSGAYMHWISATPVWYWPRNWTRVLYSNTYVPLGR